MTKKEILAELNKLIEIPRNTSEYHIGDPVRIAKENSDALTKLDNALYSLYIQIEKDIKEEE